MRTIRSDLASMRQVGFAAEHHPHYSNQTAPLHGIDVVLLTYIARGRGRHQLEDRTFGEHAGSLSITHYGQQHALHSDDMDVFNIFLDPQHHPLPILPEPLQATMTQLIPLHPNFYHRGSEVVRVTIHNRAGMDDLLHAIHNECQSPGEGHHEMMRIYMKLFLITICREALGTETTEPRHPSHPMERLRLHLDKTFADRHRLRPLARQVGMHPGALCRAFKAYTGMSVMSYLDERRLHAAMLGLRNTDDTVLAIAMDAGFPDISRFNRLFKARIGMTPSNYRKQFR